MATNQALYHCVYLNRKGNNIMEKDPFGFADAVDEDAIEALTPEQVDTVLEILSKMDD